MNRHYRFLLGALVAGCLLAGCNKSPEPSPAGGSGSAGAARPSAEGTDDNREPVQRAVVAETLAYAEVDDKLVKGHFVFPEDMIEPLPAIILIHEWWGLNADMRGLADRFAGEGYIVLAIDLFDGVTASSPAEARQLMQETLQQPEFALQNIAQACQWVLNTTGATQVATVGYGFGGDWSMTAATEFPQDVDAAVVFYGRVSSNEAALAKLNAPLLGLFGGEDGRVSAESIDAMKAAMDALNKPYEVEIYPSGKSGFASPGNRNFNERLEQITWDKLTTFLRKHLQGGSTDAASG